MSIYSIPPIISAFIILTLGFFVFFKAKKSIISFTFTGICTTVFVWLFGFGISYSFTDPKIIIVWQKFAHTGVNFIPVIFYHFTVLFLGKKKERKFVYLSYIISALFTASLWFSDHFITGLYKYTWGSYVKAGPIKDIFLLYYFIIFVRGFALLYSGYQEKKKQIQFVECNRIRYIFIAFLIGTFGSIDYFQNYGADFYPFGFIFVIILVSIIGYAIVAHHLLDIQIVFKKTLVYSLLVTALSIINIVFLYALEPIFRQFFGLKVIPPILNIALIAILFQPLYRMSTAFVDNIFFKGSLPKVAEELQKSEKLAALGVLASGLAHDIKNPLAPIKTYIQNLPSNLNNFQYIEKITKIIPEEVDKITDTINQLRDFANPPPLSKTKINLHNLIDKRFNLLEEEFKSKNITIQKQYSPALPGVNADSIQLERVFINLFLNAIDAMPNGGKLTIATEQSDNQVLIKISDTGIGIEKETLPHIFNPFFSKGKHKGTGLGLAIVQQIIKEHNGNINVESITSKGTKFCILLPMR